jgi:hypothetical protein
MCAMPALAPLLDHGDDVDTTPPRPALAGGSKRPPHDGDPPGEVIPFPLERITGPAAAPAFSSEEAAADTAEPLSDGALWAAWMSGVLSTRVPVGGTF